MPSPGPSARCRARSRTGSPCSSWASCCSTSASPTSTSCRVCRTASAPEARRSRGQARRSSPGELRNSAPTTRPTCSNAATFIDTTINARIVVDRPHPATALADSRQGLPLHIADYPVVAAAARPDTSRSARRRSASPGTPRPRCRSATAVHGFRGIVLVSSPLTDLQRAVRSVEHQILLAGGLALIASLFAGYLASYFIARRLKRIERGAAVDRLGRLLATGAARAADEIGQLAVTFNMMGGRLRDAFSQIEREKRTSRCCSTTSAEGVIGVTAEGELAIANPAAATLLRRALPTGVPLVELLPPMSAQALVEMQADGEDRMSWSSTRGRSLEASCTAWAASPRCATSSCCATSPSRPSSMRRAATSSPPPRTSSRRRCSRSRGSWS